MEAIAVDLKCSVHLEPASYEVSQFSYTAVSSSAFSLFLSLD